MKRAPIGLMVAALCMSLALPYAQAADETSDDLVTQAQQAFSLGDAERAMELANKAVAADAQNVRALLVRAALHSERDAHEQAIADYDRAIQLRPDEARLYDLRGSEHFKAGHIDASIADFDRRIELDPASEPHHWQRGISYYYARRWKEGQRQFEGYQTVDDNDVENVAWRYLCMAQDVGPEAAREAMLPVGHDPRVPLMTVYKLYCGEAEPSDVLEAVQTAGPDPDRQRNANFYAHLYLGLYYESLGQREKTIEHLRTAVEKHQIPHYMGDVARVHLERLTGEQ